MMTVPMPAQTKIRPKTYSHRGDGERAGQPDGVVHPVHDRHHGRRRAAEGELDPDVRSALLRERAAQLRGEQAVGNQEKDDHHDQPGERLRPVARDSAERVQNDDRGEHEERGVQASHAAPELLAFLARRDRGHRVNRRG
jgi:hypothetical protein